MGLGSCPECGWAMRVKAITSDGQVFIECSNPNCGNKWGDQLRWEVSAKEG